MAQLADDPQADNDDDVKGNAEYDPKDTADMFEKYQERYLEFEKTIGFPIDTNNIFNEDFDNEVVYKHMTQTYPVCHGSILLLAHRFILMKQNYGTFQIEKIAFPPAFYPENVRSFRFAKVPIWKRNFMPI